MAIGKIGNTAGPEVDQPQAEKPAADVALAGSGTEAAIANPVGVTPGLRAHHTFNSSQIKSTLANRLGQTPSFGREFSLQANNLRNGAARLSEAIGHYQTKINGQLDHSKADAGNFLAQLK